MGAERIPADAIDALTAMPGWLGTEDEAIAAILAVLAAIRQQPGTALRDLQAAVWQMVADYQASDQHHPGWVLVRAEAFDAAARALAPLAADILEAAEVRL